MTFTPKIRSYLEEQIGKDYVEGFEVWALVGMRSIKKTDGTCIDSWNFAHPRDKIRGSMNVFDAVDRMIEIWKERFG
jgi:hypothetical protein